MANQLLDPDTGDDTNMGPTEERPPGMPGWVKVFGVIVILLVLLVAGLIIFGGGEHGPGRHTPSGAPGSNIHTIAYRIQQP